MYIKRPSLTMLWCQWERVAATCTTEHLRTPLVCPASQAEPLPGSFALV